MTEPIRVAQVVGKMVGGGVEAVVMNYYRHIDRSKVQFDFLVDSDSTLVPREEIESLGGRVFDIPPYQHVIEYQRELQRLFKQEGWVIVHSHINALSVFPLCAAKKAGVPVRIAHSHSSSGKGEYIKNAMKSILKTQANRYPNYRFACSKHAGEWLFGKNVNFEVIYNAIDLSHFLFDVRARVQLRAELGLNDGQFVIGHVGRFTAQKNHRFLIDVFSQVAKRRDDAVLLLVGSGNDLELIKSLVSERRLLDRVKFLGQRADVNRLYSAFDAFVLPSLYEGLGIVGVEAQIAGLPCLFSDAITREVDVTRSSEFLSIDSCESWIKELSSLPISSNRERACFHKSDFRNYDIHEAAHKLSNRYQELRGGVLS